MDGFYDLYIHYDCLLLVYMYIILYNIWYRTKYMYIIHKYVVCRCSIVLITFLLRVGNKAINLYYYL